MSEPDVPVPSGDAEADEEKKKRRRLFLWLFFGAVAVVVLLLVLVFSGGGEDEQVAGPSTTVQATSPPTTQPPSATTEPPAPTTTEAAGPIDVSGEWSFLIDVTEAAGICSGEEDEKVDPNQVTIRQDGTSLTVTGLNNTDPPWEGEIEGNTVTFGGERDEDDGRTKASFTLTVDDEATAMSGIEVWDWSGPGGGCTDSRSEVTAARA